MLIITRLFKNRCDYREERRGKIERRYSEVCRSGNVYARVKWSKWWLVTLSNSSFSQPWTILQCGRELRNRVPRHASRILTACSIHYSKPSAFAFSFFLFLSLTIAPPSISFPQIGGKKVRSSRNRNSFSKDRKCLLTQTRFFQTGRPPRWLLYLVSNPSPSIVWTFKSSRAVQFKSRPLRCSASSTHMAYAYFEREDSIHGIDDALKGWSIVGEKWIIASDPGGRGGRFWKRGSGCATAKQKSGQQVSSLGKGFRAASENSKNFHETIQVALHRE